MNSSYKLLYQKSQIFEKVFLVNPSRDDFNMIMEPFSLRRETIYFSLSRYFHFFCQILKWCCRFSSFLLLFLIPFFWVFSGKFDFQMARVKRNAFRLQTFTVNKPNFLSLDGNGGKIIVYSILDYIYVFVCCFFFCENLFIILGHSILCGSSSSVDSMLHMCSHCVNDPDLKPIHIRSTETINKFSLLDEFLEL